MGPRVKKRQLTLIVFLGVTILAFYIHSRRNKDTASHLTRTKSSAGKLSTLSNILLQYFSLCGTYTNSRILSYFLPMCHVFLVWCCICMSNVLLGFY